VAARQTAAAGRAPCAHGLPRSRRATPRPAVEIAWLQLCRLRVLQQAADSRTMMSDMRFHMPPAASIALQSSKMCLLYPPAVVVNTPAALPAPHTHTKPCIPPACLVMLLPECLPPACLRDCQCAGCCCEERGCQLQAQAHAEGALPG
jgi:hypothetical protein